MEILNNREYGINFVRGFEGDQAGWFVHQNGGDALKNYFKAVCNDVLGTLATLQVSQKMDLILSSHHQDDSCNYDSYHIHMTPTAVDDNKVIQTVGEVATYEGRAHPWVIETFCWSFCCTRMSGMTHVMNGETQLAVMMPAVEASQNAQRCGQKWRENPVSQTIADMVYMSLARQAIYHFPSYLVSNLRVPMTVP